jgi:hypothetical protein
MKISLSYGRSGKMKRESDAKRAGRFFPALFIDDVKLLKNSLFTAPNIFDEKKPLSLNFSAFWSVGRIPLRSLKSILDHSKAHFTLAGILE